MPAIGQANAPLIIMAMVLAVSHPKVVEAQLPIATGRQIAMSQPEWKLFIPDGYQHRLGEKVDLLVHFHGDPQTVWNNVEYADLNAVVVTANYNGLSSAYRVPFTDPNLFRKLINDAMSRLRGEEDFGGAAKWDRFAVSSFSAGYGAVREILKNPLYVQTIDSLLAADSLYASTDTDGTPVDSQLVDYKNFASLAAAGDKQFIFTHTRVPTFTYENTEETANELLEHLGLEAVPTEEVGLGPIPFFRKATQGNFQLWGSPGVTGPDHLDHLRYMGQWLDELSLAERPAPGDFNADGRVDAADYTAWRDGLGNVYTQSDYDVWREHYGQTSEALNQSQSSAASIPEPSTLILFLTALWMTASRSGLF